MEDAAKQIVDEINRLASNGESHEAIRDRWDVWRRHHGEIRDFAGATFRRANLATCDFSKLNLSHVHFDGCHLASADFTQANLGDSKFCLVSGAPIGLQIAAATSASFRGAFCLRSQFCGDFRNANFSSATIGVDFEGSDLRGAKFDYAEILHSRFISVDVNAATSFVQLEGFGNVEIDQHFLDLLGPQRGQLTWGNLREAVVVDDVMKLREQFGGFWTLLHSISLIWFIAPYAWFLISLLMNAKLSQMVGDSEDTVTVLSALLRFVLRGKYWRDGWEPDFIWFGSFLILCAYNACRASLLWKTKAIETRQEVSGIPVNFYLWQHLALCGRTTPITWRHVWNATRWGLIASYGILLIKTISLLNMRVSVS